MTVDSTGKPVEFTLTGGQVSDYSEAQALLAHIKAEHVLADKGYDSDAVVACIESQGAEAVIPPRRNRKQPRPFSRGHYKCRNVIERSFNLLKYFRRIATRYDRKALYFSAFLYLASAITWG